MWRKRGAGQAPRGGAAPVANEGRGGHCEASERARAMAKKRRAVPRGEGQRGPAGELGGGSECCASVDLLVAR